MNMYVPWLLLSHYQFGVKENEEKKINKKSFDAISFFKDFLKHHYLLFIFLGLEGAIVVTHPTADVTHTRESLLAITGSYSNACNPDWRKSFIVSVSLDPSEKL